MEPIQPAAIVLSRTNQYTAILTKFDVYIDGQKVGSIGNNEQVRIVVAPGKYTIHLKIDSFSSKKVTVTVNSGESVRLVCKPKAFGIGASIEVI